MKYKPERRGGTNWAAQYEIGFIENMIAGKTRRMQFELLTKYIDSMKNRTRWGDIDRDKVRAFALALLMKVRRGK